MMRGENFMAKEKVIEGLIIEPNQFPRKLRIENELTAFQKAVKGYIECIDLPNGATLICNEEGKINGEPLNRILYDDTGKVVDIVAGNMVIVGFDAESGEFTSITEKQAEEATEEFMQPDMFFRTKDNIHMVNIGWQMNLVNDTDITFTDPKTEEVKHSIVCDNDFEQIRVFAFINGIRSEIVRNMSCDTATIEISTNEKSNDFHLDFCDEER